eukprot:TRINITY_DN7300_c0_g2_i1.p1 TRINITY_DN7300_c0_g2~~TRINITY_DN7300_c0_g2_i1.p1  ORF type:complete len:274 (+),score=138.44 TRINITY_DN7300_c0_g2_i1:59-880(+)
MSMLRRCATQAVRRGAMSQMRFQAAPAWATPKFIEIFNTDFASATYPVNAMGGDHLLFSKLMFQIAQAEKKEEKYVKDFAALLQASAAGNFGTFWRTETDVATAKEFASMEPGMKFVLKWMQSSNAMEHLEDVAKIFTVYAKAAKKTVVVPVTLAGLPDSQTKAAAAARKAAEETLNAAADRKGWKIEFEYFVDPGIIDGWRVEVDGLVVEDMSAYLAARDNAASAAASVDYLSGPTMTSVATTWPRNAETEILSQWCEELSLFDAEEAKYGA